MIDHEINTAGVGHPVDHNLHALELLEHGIEAQLEFEHQLIERDKREIALATCFPQGRLILRGAMRGMFPTIDPEVFRSELVQEGKIKGMLYINRRRKVCVAVDWEI